MAFFVVIPLVVLIVSSWWAQVYINKSKDRLIWAQQETMQKLLNREPVTYAEVGQEPNKPNTERYSAWGNRIHDTKDFDEE